MQMDWRLPIGRLLRSLRWCIACHWLFGLGVDNLAITRRTAVYVDKILKGVKPSELPVEQPTKFQFLINLKTAKALDLNISLFLQQRADEVIE
jgi:putative ABC transport system substrate-binding protein